MIKMMMMMMFLFTNCQSSLQPESGGWKVRHHCDSRDQAGQGDHHHYQLEHYRHHHHYRIHEIKQDKVKKIFHTGLLFALMSYL